MVTEEQELAWVSEYVVAILKAPTWVAPISKFVDENCSTFEDVEENKLEHTLIHNAFKQLIDELLTAHLEELNVSTELFTKFCERGLSGNNELHRSLVEQLLSVEDFLVFKAMMVKRNADLHREVIGPSPLIRRSPEEEAEAAGGVLALEAMPPSAQDEAERIEAERKCVEAELQLAEALSLQLEKRLQLMEALDEVLELVAKIYKLQADAMEAKIAEEMAAQQAAEEAAAGMLPLGQEPLAPPLSAPLAPLTAAPLAPLEPLAQPHQMPGPALPSSVCVRPLHEVPLAPPPAASNPNDILALERKKAEAAVQKERANRAAAARAPPAPLAYTPAAYTPELVTAATAVPCYSAPAAASTAPQQPTEEERRARAEHLKRQRELLVQKKNQEREAQLTTHQAIYGQTTAARVAERACAQPSPLQQAPVSPDDAGRRLAAELSGVGTPVVAGPTPETKAQEMRKVLTRQLKATLTSSMSGTF
mmetsp:Transcript_100455/g.174331  ORF Transcript_100455/g.174331 Transcript_100455/m.174331 type:complete len:479 (-) Transcript_100455:80-1516(-)